MSLERPPKNDPGGSRIRDMRIKRANAHYRSGSDLEPVGTPHLLFKGSFLQALASLGRASSAMACVSRKLLEH
jgi:hypothetical protein